MCTACPSLFASTAAGLLACAAGSFLAALLAAHLDDCEHPRIGWLALYVLALGMTVLFAIDAIADAMLGDNDHDHPVHRHHCRAVLAAHPRASRGRRAAPQAPRGDR
jgi:hypothetical protein